MLWAVTLAVVYLAICLLFFLAQASLVYFPARDVRLSPKDFGMEFEDVWLTASDGVSVHGWAVPRSGAEVWILYCHGNGGNIAGRLDILRWLHRLGANVLAFDYRGYGKSNGSPSEDGLYRDAEAAWTWLSQARGVRPERIVVLGESLGGGVACGLAERHPPGGLALQSTFTSVPDVGAPVYWWLPVRLLCRNVFPSGDRVSRLGCPKLIMHGKRDEIIPYALGRALFEKAAEPKRWLDLPGGHNDGAWMADENVRNAMRGFLEEVSRAGGVETRDRR